MKTIFCIIFLFGLLNNIFSQKNEHLYLKGKTEFYTSVSFLDNAEIKNDYSLQIQTNHYLFENFSLGTRANYFSNNGIDISIIGEFSVPILSNRIIPFILVGYGYNIQVYDVNLHSNYNLKDYHLSELLSIGSGIKIPIFSHLCLRTEVCYAKRPGKAFESVKSNIFSLINPKKSQELIYQNFNYSIGLSLFI